MLIDCKNYIIANVKASVDCRGWVTPALVSHCPSAAWLLVSGRWVEAVNHPAIMVTGPGQCWAALWSLWGQSHKCCLISVKDDAVISTSGYVLA